MSSQITKTYRNKLIRPRPLTGVVPVASHVPIGLDVVWDPVLTPLAEDWSAIRQAVWNCVQGGCETVWIIVDQDTQPLVRHHIGSSWLDYRPRDIVKSPKAYRHVPIYYAPISLWDRGVRDSHGWAALYGCYVARRVSFKMGRWLKPWRFMISWPFGVTELPQYFRSVLKRERKDILITKEGKSVKDGLHLPFTISWGEVRRLKRRVWHNSSLNSDWFGNRINEKERYNARFFNLEDVFRTMETPNHWEMETDHYHLVDSWENYKEFVKDSDFIVKPTKDVYHIREYRGINTSFNLDD